MSMKFEILNRWSGAVKFTAEVDCAEDAPWRVKVGLAVRWAVSTRADLADANLTRADLTGANLADANLTGANLTGANLTGANLAGADLADANLTRANLTGANLTGADLADANLADANLADANLADARNDLWDVLLRAPGEVEGLLQALREGRVNGSTYHGECACLVGTIANIRHRPFDDLGDGLVPDSSRPAERWFLGIREGDTPISSSIAKITEGWIVEFLALILGFAVLERMLAVGGEQ